MDDPNNPTNVGPGSADLVQAIAPNYSNMFNVRPGGHFGASQGALNYFNTLSPEDQAGVFAGMQNTQGIGPLQLRGQAALNYQLNNWFRNAVNAGTVPGLEANSYNHGNVAGAQAASQWTAPQPQGNISNNLGAGNAAAALNAFTPNAPSANQPAGGANLGVGNAAAQAFPQGPTPPQPAAPPPTDYKALQEKQRQQQQQRQQWTANRQNPPQM